MIDEKLRAKLKKIVERQNSDSKLNDSQAKALKNARDFDYDDFYAITKVE